MSARIQGLKGMPDILPKETALWQPLESQWRDLMQSYCYEEIRLPILEKTALFKRSIGEVTDIVEKEMFTFLDRDEESITLRPEGTAGCVRAGSEHGLLYNQIQRLWYMGPMFRYEKPQKGRYRQFYQLAIEAFGLEGPDVDVEQILMMARFLKKLGVYQAVSLQINSLGSKASREQYRRELVEYFEKYVKDLDEDSQRRLKTNPLRILDSKNIALADIIRGAPKSIDTLLPEDRQHFERFQELLQATEIPYVVNPCLVRGLDYYNRTVYEWVTDQLGAQGTVCAGGRYDSLIEQLSGKPGLAVGFAAGIDRLILLQQTLDLKAENSMDIFCICIGQEAENKGFVLAEKLRDQFPGLKMQVNCGGGNFKNQFKRADKSQAKIAFIIAENELKTDSIGIKFLREEREQLSLPLNQVDQFLQPILKANVKNIT